MNKLSSSLIAAAITATTAAAQFVPNIGAAQGPVGDDALVTLNLGFNFTFPDGTATSTIDVDSNGRILPSLVGNSSEFDDTVATLLNGPSSICVFWDDLTPAGLGRGDIYFATDNASEAVITWSNVKRFGNTTYQYNDFSFQAILRSTGEIVCNYDRRVFTTSSNLVGVSSGNAAIDPGEIDISAGAAGGAGPTVYQHHDSSSETFDLGGKSLTFTPDGAGGYSVAVSDAGATTAGAENYGAPTPVTIEFFPDGSGGYFVTRTFPQFFDDGGAGTELAAGGLLGDDSYTAPQPLPFAFPWPSTDPLNPVTTTDIVIGNNGRIMSDASSPVGGSFNPSVQELTDYGATIAVYWTDMSSQRGSLRIYNDPAGAFTAITWENTPKFYEEARLTFQAVIRPDGTFTLNYKDVSGWATGSGFTSDDVLIGCSPGFLAADPGPVDFSQSTIALGGQPTLYEFWDSNTDIPDIHTMLWPQSPNTTAAPMPNNRYWTEPTINSNYEFTMEGITSGTLQANVLIGFSSTNIPMDIIGINGGTLLTNPTLPALPLTITGTTATGSLSLNASPSLIGLPLHIQGANLAPGETSLGVVLTNGIQGTLRL